MYPELELWNGCMDLSDILQHDALYPRSDIDFFRFYGYFWYFLVYIDFVSILRTPIWLDGFIRHIIPWWPICLGWSLCVWILKQMKLGDFIAVFLTFQMNIDYVHNNFELLHGWLDLSDISKHGDLYLRDEICLFVFWKKKLGVIFFLHFNWR